MHIVDHDPLDRLQEAARGHRNTRTWPRVQAISLAKQGDSAAQIARALGASRRAVPLPRYPVPPRHRAAIRTIDILGCTPTISMGGHRKE